MREYLCGWHGVCSSQHWTISCRMTDISVSPTSLHQVIALEYWKRSYSTELLDTTYIHCSTKGAHTFNSILYVYNALHCGLTWYSTHMRPYWTLEKKSDTDKPGYNTYITGKWYNYVSKHFAPIPNPGSSEQICYIRQCCIIYILKDEIWNKQATWSLTICSRSLRFFANLLLNGSQFPLPHRDGLVLICD